MGASGTAILDFGARPVSDTSLAVTGQGTILAGSLVEAWIWPLITADHTADEHIVEELMVYAGNVVAGVGFTIYLTAQGPDGSFGQWSVAWVWV
jgi:hypothetical protein